MNPYGLNNLENDAIDFASINLDTLLDDYKKAVEELREEVKTFKAETGTSFKDVIERMEGLGNNANNVLMIFYTLFYAHNTEKIQAVSEEISALSTEVDNDLNLDPELFAKVKACYDNRHNENLTEEQMTVLENHYKGYVRSGALLNDEDKAKYREISGELSTLSVKFNQNTLAAMNEYKLVVEDESRLKGIPEYALDQAKELAKKEGKESAWIFTLHAPSRTPVLTYCEDRELRRELTLASSVMCTSGEHDNREIVKRTVKLRHEKAKLLGYKDHADYVLDESMAKSVDGVMNLLEPLLEKSYEHAKSDIERLKELAKKDGIEDFHSWDRMFYTEKLKKIELDFDDEEVKPYFQLEKCLDGIFAVAKKLYNISLKENKNLPVYHEEVLPYDVIDDSTGEFIGHFYCDLFPRDTKSSGAWMMGIRSHGLQHGKMMKPVVSITCNFTRPTAKQPSLLDLNQVRTLFHEFGHALHGLLSKCQYTSVSGTSVFRDFVELPSQVLENWMFEKECLDLFAKHYQTGEAIPDELITKIKKNLQFMEGFATVRQISFGLLDMAWHGQEIDNIEDVDVIEFEKEAMEKTQLLPRIDGDAMSTSFGHLFAGGYSAGYYSYKWAEVLDADAFEAFKENGIFDRETAKKFRENILEKGGSAHPMELYKRFRGHEPSVDALIRRAGF